MGAIRRTTIEMIPLMKRETVVFLGEFLCEFLFQLSYYFFLLMGVDNFC
jgi:hypothetical protein